MVSLQAGQGIPQYGLETYWEDYNSLPLVEEIAAEIAQEVGECCCSAAINDMYGGKTRLYIRR